MNVPLIAGPKAIVLVIVVLLVGAIGGGLAFGILGVPDVTGIENRFGAVNESVSTVETDLHLHNPNPIGATVGGATIEYTIEMNEIDMAHGTREGIAIERGNSTISLSTSLHNERIPAWWSSHLRNGERTDLTIDADVHLSSLGRTITAPAIDREIETDLLSAFNSTETREVNADRPLVSDPIFVIEETSAEWGTITDERTEMDVEFLVYNPNVEPIPITEVHYEITMNDVEVGSGEIEETYLIGPGQRESVSIAAGIENDRLDEWWVSHLDEEVHGHQVSELQIDFYVKVDLSNYGGGTVLIPLEELTYVETIDTDIFGTKDQDDESWDGEEANGNDNDGVDDTGVEDGGDDMDEENGADGTDETNDDDDGNDDENENENGEGDDGRLPLDLT